ncbi:MAG: MFS transporter [Myxococcota bacterium]
MPSADHAMRRVARLYSAFQLFFGLLLWVPIFYEYQRRVGLSDQQIFSIQSIYYLAFLFLELPTGLIADRFGYRQALRLGAAVLLVANVLPVASPSFLGFLWHWVLIALARSLISGASSAYLYEYLLGHNAAEQYKRIEGGARAYGLVAKVLVWPTVGLLMSWHMPLPYWITALFAAIALLVAERLPEVRPTRIGPTGETTARLSSWRRAWQGFANQVRTVRAVTRASPVLLLLMLQGIGIFVLERICQVSLFQPILESKGFLAVSYGWVLSVNTIFEAWGSARSNWLRRWMSDLSAVLVLTVVMGTSLSLIALTGKVGAVVGLTTFAWASGLAFPIRRQVMNEAISDSRYRATLLSFESILDRAGSAAVAAVLGGFVARGQTDMFLLLSAGVTVVVGVVLYVVIRRRSADGVAPSVASARVTR